MELVTNILSTTNVAMGRGTMTDTEYEVINPPDHSGIAIGLAIVLVAIAICSGWLWLSRQRKSK